MKKLFNIEELLADDHTDNQYDDLSEDQIVSNLPNLPVSKLADIVIMNRYIGSYKDLSVLAMKELSNRRLSGDDFQYEKYIDDNLGTLPKLDFTLPDVKSLLDKIKVFNK